MYNCGMKKHQVLYWFKGRLKHQIGMMNIIFYGIFLLLSSSFVHSADNNYYTIVSPKVLRPNSDYLISVSIQYADSPTLVNLEINGQQNSGGVFKATQSVTVDPFSTRIVRLEISDTGPGSYSLIAQGTGGVNFRNTTTLEYMHKSYSVFIQTDKAIYKPGHKVLFRVIVLNPTLRPVSTTFLDIYFTDGKNNRIKEWKRQVTTYGVYSSELQLSEHPVLGHWNITVSIQDQLFKKSFEVAEYVLPKFEVSISTPSHAIFKDNRLVATIHAKYTYGKPVKGEATISVNPNIYSGVIQPFLLNPIYKVVPINGKAVVEFDLTKDLKLSDDYERIIQLDVAVEETPGGRRQNNSIQVVLHRHRYKMELVKTMEYFKPGLKYTAHLKLLYHDGKPVTDNVNYVKVKQFYSYNDDEFTESKHRLSEDGIVDLHYYPPRTNVTILRIEAEYLDLKESLPSIAAAVSPSNTFIQAVLKTKNPTVNQFVEIDINCTEQIEFVHYEVFGRGGIITANTFVLPRNSSSATIKVMTTATMAPAAHFVVHYVNDAGEVIADEIDIELNELLQNYVHATSLQNELEPGNPAEVLLEAKPHSFIGVLGVDQSVLLLRTGHDITHDTVYNELKSYDTGDASSLRYIRDIADERSMHLLPSSFTAQQAFTKSGAAVMTNAYVHEHNPWVYYRTNIFDELDAYVQNENSTWTSPKSSGVVRSNFPETWIWNTFETGFDGKATLKKTIPDTITSWVISAFSIDNVNGFGLLNEPLKLKSFKSFFISLDLPYSVMRGEVIAVPAMIFNYLNSDAFVDVTMENIGEFEFADYSNEIEAPVGLELYRRKRISVAAGTGKSISFLIKPIALGHISIKLVANSPIAGDAIEKKLLVKPEGETIYKTKSMFIDLRTNTLFEKQLTLDIPKNIISSSEYIEVSVIGDVIGSSVLNVGNLLRMPFGCGEQNMLNFVPNIVVLEYLRNTHRLTQAIESKAIQFLESGYQQELTFRRSDGSFSAFGSSDPSGSTWLTAFVAKSFRQAALFINVEESVIMDALQWLSEHQSRLGSFPEMGKIYHTEMQGGSTNEISLTAYTLIAFLENAKATSQFRTTILRATEYIVNNLHKVADDPYALAICTYALALADHPERNAAFDALESNAQTAENLKFWKRKDRESDKNNPWTKVPNSLNIEMTSYALLSYVKKGLYEDAIPILNWLITQQNDQGGFASTQDTVVAIYSLSKLAEKIASKRTNLIVNITSDDSTHKATINEGNSLVLQKYEMHRNIRNISITSYGTGFAVVHVSYRYNVNVTGEWPLFILDPQIDKNSNSNHLQLSVCTSFVGGNESNMAVMEINLPSGFTADMDSLPSLLLSNLVKKVETRDGDTAIVLYFDKMTKKEICPTISAHRVHRVAHQRSVPIVEYDYYDQTRRSRVFYEIPGPHLCDICEETDCAKICDGKLKFQKSEKEGNSANLSASCAHLTLVLGLICFSIVKHLLCN
ncbi:CD109 antigen-like isoform X2 [Planococcus citri]|uniref:CD109 antigen-like isoform X2 n=1 Tax=Planococcus citri TaxID=170843 RepID=UPI0031F74905